MPIYSFFYRLSGWELICIIMASTFLDEAFELPLQCCLCFEFLLFFYLGWGPFEVETFFALVEKLKEAVYDF